MIVHDFWCYANGKASMIVYAQESFSASDIINIEGILEGIYLWSNIFSLHNEYTILELI